MKSGSGVKYSGHLKMHWSWNVYLSLSLIGLTIGLFTVSKRAGLICLGFSAAYYLAVILIYAYYRPRILQALIGFASNYGSIESQLLKDLEIPTAIVDREGRMLWMNDRLRGLTGKTEWYHKEIDTIFPYLTRPVFPVNSESKDIDLSYGEKQYRAHIQKVILDQVTENSRLIGPDEDEDESEGLGDLLKNMEEDDARHGFSYSADAESRIHVRDGWDSDQDEDGLDSRTDLGDDKDSDHSDSRADMQDEKDSDHRTDLGDDKDSDHRTDLRDEDASDSETDMWLDDPEDGLTDLQEKDPERRMTDLREKDPERRLTDLREKDSERRLTDLREKDPERRLTDLREDGSGRTKADSWKDDSEAARSSRPEDSMSDPGKGGWAGGRESSRKTAREEVRTDGRSYNHRRASRAQESWIYLIHFIDETELTTLRQENREEKPVVALVYLDNYEEAMDNVDEVHSSLMNVLVDREINKYSLAHKALNKKLEKDKYLLVMNQKSLESIEADHFSLLEEVKTINIGNDTVMTISIGAGIGGTDYNQNYDYARAAIEMALGRGGDQAVLNRDGQMNFFGGKSQSGERHTRVKARVKAQAMREIMESKERVLTMGHKITDMDSLGAAVGIYRAAKTLGKPAWIVIGDDSPSIRNWLEMLRESRDYEEDIFITHEKAIELCDDNTALIVVDTARRTMVECEELLTKTKTIVVLDHHRQTTEQIQNAALSYIEPGASSACEMVAEVLQYFEDNVRLKSLEADCLYAGIIIDTNGFVAKTGARTFEAAAYLRRMGADITRVRKALRDDMDSYKARAEAVRHAESFMDCYAISILPSEGLNSPNVVGAQAANELLDIVGVKASFVVTNYNGKVFISARAIDEINVQIIMERLGGGGHMNIAGAQLQDVTCEEAVIRIKEILRSMTEAGEI